MFQTDEQMFKICTAWLAQVAAEKRPGKQYLIQDQDGTWKFSPQNGLVVAEYIEKHFNKFVSMENLDRAISNLAKSGRLVGFKTESPDLDISKPGKSTGSISIGACGDPRKILDGFFGRLTAAQEKQDHQLREINNRGFVPLPRRELTQEEMHRATKEQLKEYCAWKNGSDVRNGGNW